MAPDSWLDIIEPADKEAFVGRLEQIETFHRLLCQSPPRYLIYYISGQGGAGKTKLLSRYRQIAVEQKFLVVESDELQGDIPSILAHFAAQLTRQDHELKTFDAQYRKYRQIRQEIEGDSEAPKGIADFIGRTAIRASLMVANEVPFLRQGTALVKVDEVEEQGAAVAKYLAQRFGNRHDEIALVRQPVQALTGFFFQDLNKLAERLRCLLCFDNFEATRDYLDPWLAILPQQHRPSPNISLAIACRTPPTPSNYWEGFLRVTHHTVLDIFTEAEAADFLDQHRIQEPERRQAILEVSGRLPVLMSLLASADGDHPVDAIPINNIVERFLRWDQQPERQQVALRAALLRNFTLDNMVPLCQPDTLPEQSEAFFDWLTTRPFVTYRTTGWHFHPVVRGLFVRYQRERSLQSYRQRHQQLAEHFTTQMNSLIGEATPWSDEIGIELRLQYLYHRFLSNPLRHWADIIEDFADSLALEREQAVPWLPFFQDAILVDELPAEHQDAHALFIRYLPKLENDGSSDALPLLAHLSVIGQVPNTTRTKLYMRSAHMRRGAKEYQATLADFTKAIELQPDNGNSYLWRGYTYLEAKEYPAALADFTKAIELQPDDSNNYKWRGLTYREMKEYQATLADFTKAIELQPDNGNSYLWRGLIYYLTKEYSAALTDYTKAIELQPDIGANYYGRGFTYREAKEYPAALADFTKAIELQPDNGDNYYGRGYTYREMKEYSAALADFTKAIGLQPDNGDNYYGRGRTYREAKEYPAALADFTKAIELQPDDGNNYHWRGLTYLEAKEHPAALADFTKAIELQPDNGNNYNGRGRTYRVTKEYPAALADFTKAIELQPDNGNNYKWRGRTYLEVKKYLEALADFVKAIELQPDNEFNYQWRGITHQLTGETTLTQSDFDRAITLATDALLVHGTAEKAFILARFQLATGDYATAQQLYTDTLALPAEVIEVQEALEALKHYQGYFPDNTIAQAIYQQLEQWLIQQNTDKEA